MFFDGWEGIGRTLLVGVLAYVALVAIVRVSGKRTLSKMNAFDLIVTVALGSTLATILLSSDVALAEGITALALLVALQFVIAVGSSSSQRIDRLVKSEPALLAYEGRPLENALTRERVPHTELLQAVRQHGLASLDEASAVVLESDGTFAVIPRAADGGAALHNVRGWQDRPESSSGSGAR